MTARILVADGSATTRIMMKVRLAAACYEVMTASSSKQLLRSLADDTPDLVILGSALTDCDQVSVCKLITQQQPGITILALTTASGRIQILRAGATGALDPGVNEQMLLARIRGLLREDDQGSGLLFSMAEAPAPFEDSWAGNVALVADSPARALRWRYLLQSQLNCRLSINSPEEALAAAAAGHSADLYLIAAHIGGHGDGLRLMSELRSRQGSRNAAFIVADNKERGDFSTIALDLGAGDVLPLELTDGGDIEIAKLTLQKQLQRKRRADSRRDAERRNREWAITDPLTGLYNRRYAEPRLSKIADAAMRDRQAFAAMILDLDYFKSINDNYGHAAGDAVLCEVARRLQAVVADRGILARLGGEEFLVVLPQTDERLAYRIAEDIRRAIGMHGTPLPRLSGGGEIRVTASVGIAIGDRYGANDTATDLAKLVLERADQALIAAKAQGRNRVMMGADDAWLRA